MNDNSRYHISLIFRSWEITLPVKYFYIGPSRPVGLVDSKAFAKISQIINVEVDVLAKEKSAKQKVNKCGHYKKDYFRVKG